MSTNDLNLSKRAEPCIYIYGIYSIKSTKDLHDKKVFLTKGLKPTCLNVLELIKYLFIYVILVLLAENNNFSAFLSILTSCKGLIHCHELNTLKCVANNIKIIPFL